MIEDDNGSVRATVAKLASDHNVIYVETDLDAFAEVATRLAGDVVKLDDTERLMLALARAGVIDRPEAVSMFVAYGREKKLAAAIQRYVDEEISLGKAAREAGLGIADFMEALGAREIPCIRFDADDLEQEMRQSDE